jgi:hypothetical protein
MSSDVDTPPLTPTETEDQTRVTVTWWAPFDRVVALTALGLCSGVLLVCATVLPAQIIGALIAAVALPKAGVILMRELKTPRLERGIDVIETDAGRWS